jgi:hypothetical protein
MIIITPKYNLNDNVWYLDTENNPFPKVKEMCIHTIRGFIDKNGTQIYYNGYDVEEWNKIPERFKQENIFATKDELLKSL